MHKSLPHKHAKGPSNQQTKTKKKPQTNNNKNHHLNSKLVHTIYLPISFYRATYVHSYSIYTYELMITSVNIPFA